jgi:hypothetical protein
MKQFVLKKSGNEFDDESKKYTAMNDKLNELYEKLLCWILKHMQILVYMQLDLYLI